MRRSAFTMVEILAVIAIIAILSAITFPVLARTKEAAYKGGDLQNMNAIRSAIQLYRVDQGAYPPQILGYATLYATGPNAGNVMPANEIKSYLYPKRIESVDVLKPAFERSAKNVVVTAVWPSQDPRAVGDAPIFDANGDGALTNVDDDACSRQMYGPATTVQRRDPVTGNPINAQFYKVSGYDIATVRTASGSRIELRYALFWSRWGLGDAGCSPSGTSGNAMDDPRQLGYYDPPENTVITWNSYFRQYNSSGVAQRGKSDQVLFLGGAAKAYDSLDLSERSWRVTN